MRTPIGGPAAWRGDMLGEDWIVSFSPAHLAELDAALDHVRTRAFTSFAREDFPLQATVALLGDVAGRLENGAGIVRLRGLPVGRYALDDLRRLFWGIGRWLGTPLFQNARGEIMGEVRDETRLAEKTYAPTEEGHVASARARSRSTGPLRWHTDRCDVIALLCARNALAGGLSKIASIVTIHDEMLKRRPDLLEVLFAPYWRARPSDEDGAGGPFALPVFGLCDGRITSQYSRTYVEQAQEIASVPRLTEAQEAALDLLAAIAEECCLTVPFEPGDIQLLNNHIAYHGRTAYEDDAEAGQDRLLLRLWLSMPNSRRLPDGFEVLWGATAPGVVRGGVVQTKDGSRHV